MRNPPSKEPKKHHAVPSKKSKKQAAKVPVAKRQRLSTGDHEDVENVRQTADACDMSDYVSRMNFISKHLRVFMDYLRPSQGVIEADVKRIINEFESGGITLESENSEAAVNGKLLDDDVLPVTTKGVASTLPSDNRLEGMMSCIVQVAEMGVDGIFDGMPDVNDTDREAFETLKAVLDVSQLPVHRHDTLFLYMQVIGHALYALSENKRDSTSFVYTASALAIMAEMTTRSGYTIDDTASKPESLDAFHPFSTIRQYFQQYDKHRRMVSAI